MVIQARGNVFHTLDLKGTVERQRIIGRDTEDIRWVCRQRSEETECLSFLTQYPMPFPSCCLIQTPLEFASYSSSHSVYNTSLHVNLSVCKHIHLKEIREKKNEGAKAISCLLSLKLHPPFMIPLKFAYWEQLEQHLIFFAKMKNDSFVLKQLEYILTHKNCVHIKYRKALPI